MKRYLLILAVILQSTLLFGQVPADNIRSPATPSGTTYYNSRAQVDANLKALGALNIPHYPTFRLNGAKDSVGYVMFNTTVNRFGVYRGNGVWDTYLTTADITNLALDANVIHKTGYSSQIIQGELTTEALLLGTAGLTRMGFAQNANIAEWRFYEPVGTNGGYSISHIPGTNLFEFGSKADFTGAPIQQGGIFNYKGILRAEQTPIGSTDVVRLQEILGLAADTGVVHKALTETLTGMKTFTSDVNINAFLYANGGINSSGGTFHHSGFALFDGASILSIDKGAEIINDNVLTFRSASGVSHGIQNTASGLKFLTNTNGGGGSILYDGLSLSDSNGKFFLKEGDVPSTGELDSTYLAKTDTTVLARKIGWADMRQNSYTIRDKFKTSWFSTVGVPTNLDYYYIKPLEVNKPMRLGLVPNGIPTTTANGFIAGIKIFGTDFDSDLINNWDAGFYTTPFDIRFNSKMNGGATLKPFVWSFNDTFTRMSLNSSGDLNLPNGALIQATLTASAPVLTGTDKKLVSGTVSGSGAFVLVNSPTITGNPTIAGYTPTIRTITTTAPLTGGGDLSANRTLSLAGLTGLGTANQMLGMNNAATGYEYKTYGVANGVTITDGVGTKTWGLGSITPTAVTISSLGASKVVFTTTGGLLTATGIGASSQFIKGDGSLDATVYATSTQLSGLVDNVLTKTASYTIVAGDFVTGKKTTLDLYVDATAGAVTITLPSALTFAGYTIYVTKTDASANVITITGFTLTTQDASRQFNSNGVSWRNH